MNETDQRILQAVREIPNCTIREIAERAYYTKDCVRRHLKRLPLSKMVIVSGFRKRAKRGGLQAAEYRTAPGVKFCEACGKVIE